MAAQIVCFGAAHIDTKAIAKNPIIWGSKNPVSTRFSFGGVARNVAETLSRLDVKVMVVSRLGRDSAGDLVLAKLDADDIDITNISRSTTCKTASFTALIEPQGEMAVALSDMDIYDEMFINDELLAHCTAATMWLVDANVPEESLLKLRNRCPPSTSLWAIGTSVSKNPRFLSIIDAIDVLVVNEQEASIFDRRRPRNLVVTQGRRGAMLYTDDSAEYFPCRVDNAIDTTGAGDAFVAGLAYGYLQNKTISEAMPFAHACARMTLHTFSTVSESLSKDRLHACI